MAVRPKLELLELHKSYPAAAPTIPMNPGDGAPNCFDGYRCLVDEIAKNSMIFYFVHLSLLLHNVTLSPPVRISHSQQRATPLFLVLVLYAF